MAPDTCQEEATSLGDTGGCGECVSDSTQAQASKWREGDRKVEGVQSLAFSLQ